MSTTLNPRHAVYLGSFDPVTLGHLDIIARGARLFEKLTVGVGVNPEKSPWFSPEERLDIVRQVIRPFSNVEATCFEGLAVTFVKRCGAAAMLRGIRTLSDIEAEMEMSLTNRALAPEIETVFLMASEKYSHISSSLIKQIARLGTDVVNEPLNSFVPPEVIGPLRAKFPLKVKSG